MNIQDYPKYKIYTDGKVYSNYSNKYLKPYTTEKPYLKVDLSNSKGKKTFTIHRLVALHYIDNPNNYKQVDHIDRNPKNNNVDNLRWADAYININNRNYISNTGHKYITKSLSSKGYYNYIIKKDHQFLKVISCRKHTIEDAIKIRDELII